MMFTNLIPLAAIVLPLLLAEFMQPSVGKDTTLHTCMLVYGVYISYYIYHCVVNCSVQSHAYVNSAHDRVRVCKYACSSVQ